MELIRALGQGLGLASQFSSQFTQKLRPVRSFWVHSFVIISSWEIKCTFLCQSRYQKLKKKKKSLFPFPGFGLWSFCELLFLPLLRRPPLSLCGLLSGLTCGSQAYPMRLCLVLLLFLHLPQCWPDEMDSLCSTAGPERCPAEDGAVWSP